MTHGRSTARVLHAANVTAGSPVESRIVLPNTAGIRPTTANNIALVPVGMRHASCSLGPCILLPLYVCKRRHLEGSWTSICTRPPKHMTHQRLGTDVLLICLGIALHAYRVWGGQARLLVALIFHYTFLFDSYHFLLLVYLTFVASVAPNRIRTNIDETIYTGEAKRWQLPPSLPRRRTGIGCQLPKTDTNVPAKISSHRLGAHACPAHSELAGTCRAGPINAKLWNRSSPGRRAGLDDVL